MKRPLLPSSAFIRASRRFLRKQPDYFASELQLTLELLAEDAFHPQLKTHKLKGKLAGSWACSGGYDLRIVFQFIKHKGNDAILLESIGTHEEVY